jgi:hypothetical protein
MKSKLTIIILLILTVISCKEELETNNNLGRISQSLYPFLFDNGSYWIYRDSATNIVDSIILTSISRDTLNIPPSVPHQSSTNSEEFFGLNYYSILSGSYQEQLIGYVISKGYYKGGFLLLSSKRPRDKSENAEIVNVFDTLTIAGNLFKEVVKMKITKDEYVNANYNLYYVDSIGVIRKEIINNDSQIQVWNLLRYKTVMYKYQ